MFEQLSLKVKTLLAVERFICECFAMLVQRLISLMRVKWIYRRLRAPRRARRRVRARRLALRRPRCGGENATAGN